MHPFFSFFSRLGFTKGLRRVSLCVQINAVNTNWVKLLFQETLRHPRFFCRGVPFELARKRSLWWNEKKCFSDYKQYSLQHGREDIFQLLRGDNSTLFKYTRSSHIFLQFFFLPPDSPLLLFSSFSTLVTLYWKKLFETPFCHPTRLRFVSRQEYPFSTPYNGGKCDMFWINFTLRLTAQIV